MRQEPYMTLRQLDKKHFGRQGEPQDVIVGNSADSYLTDARGRKYSPANAAGLDATPGAGSAAEPIRFFDRQTPANGWRRVRRVSGATLPTAQDVRDRFN
jgi:hypothetical protein